MICAFDECEDEVLQRGYCPKHYMRWYRGSLEKRKCAHPGCTEPVRTETNGGKRCQRHHEQHYRESRVNYNNGRRVSAGLAPLVTNNELWTLDGGVCYLCRRALSGVIHRDHIRPVVRGGDNDISNLALVHGHCNQRKRAAAPDELASKFPNMELPVRFVERLSAGWQSKHRMTANDERFVRIRSEVMKWYDIHGKIPTQSERMDDGFKIGSWVNRVRQSKKKGRLAMWQQEMLDALEWWRW